MEKQYGDVEGTVGEGEHGRFSLTHGVCSVLGANPCL